MIMTEMEKYEGHWTVMDQITYVWKCGGIPVTVMSELFLKKNETPKLQKNRVLLKGLERSGKISVLLYCSVYKICIKEYIHILYRG